MNRICLIAIAIGVSQFVTNPDLSAANPPAAKQPAKNAAKQPAKSPANPSVKPRRLKSPLVVDLPPLEFVPIKKLRASTSQLLTAASAMPAYECSFTGEAVHAYVPREVKIDAPFRDVIVQVPVVGQSTTTGSLRIEAVPDDDELNLVAHLTGTVIMHGVSTDRGVGVATRTETKFHVTKQLACSPVRARSTPAQCRATTTIAIQGVSSSRPRLLGRIATRVGYRQASASLGTARYETNWHVESALEEYFDGQLDKLAGELNATLSDHLASLDKPSREAWSHVQFRTTKDGCRVTRNEDSSLLVARERKYKGDVVLILPRKNIGIGAVLGLLAVGQAPNQPRETDPAKALAEKSAKPVVDLEPDSVVVSMKFDAALASQTASGLPSD